MDKITVPVEPMDAGQQERSIIQRNDLHAVEQVGILETVLKCSLVRVKDMHIA